MYQVGDLVVYPSQGVCRVIDHREMEIAGVVKQYYVLNPFNDQKLEISLPVNGKKQLLHDLATAQEAEAVFKQFENPASPWIDKAPQRNQAFAEIMRRGDRDEIGQLLNTLYRKRIELESIDKKFNATDARFVENVQSNLFFEMATSLDTTTDDIYERVMKIILN